MTVAVAPWVIDDHHPPIEDCAGFRHDLSVWDRVLRDRLMATKSGRNLYVSQADRLSSVSFYEECQYKLIGLSAARAQSNDV